LHPRRRAVNGAPSGKVVGEQALAILAIIQEAAP
jgi:hypothetical protein